MKYFYNIKLVCVVSLMILISSCHDQLSQEPITNKVSSNYYSNEGEIESAVTATYAALQKNGLYNLYIPAIGEVSSDNSYDEVPANDGGIYGELDEFNLTISNGMLASIWEDSYIAIQRANIIINRIGEVEFDLELTKEARLGEVKFIRALVYFNMVRLFGDVPLVIEETTDPTNLFGQGRTSSALVYDRIILDLEEAIISLPEVGSDNSRVTKGAAQSLLGKVYLTLQDFDQAKAYLSEVGSQYSLVSDINNIFGIENENNSEVIFAVQFTSGLDGNSQGSTAMQQFAPSGVISGAKGHNLPTEELLSLYEAEDLRKDIYYQQFSGSDLYCTNKLSVNSSQTEDGGSDWVVLRYSDIVLMLAEAENETAAGLSSDTRSLLNKIRTRAGVSEIVTTDKDEIRDAIALERRLELALEGHRWFDLLRIGKAIEVMGDNGIQVEQYELLMPIPQNQIDADPSLGPNNDGY